MGGWPRSCGGYCMQQNPWKPSSHMLDHPGGLQILPSIYLSAAKLLHENTMCNDDTLYFYTDGSGIDGQVGQQHTVRPRYQQSNNTSVLKISTTSTLLN